MKKNWDSFPAFSLLRNYECYQYGLRFIFSARHSIYFRLYFYSINFLFYLFYYFRIIGIKPELQLHNSLQFVGAPELSGTPTNEMVSFLVFY